MSVNFSNAVRSNAEAEAALSGCPPQSYLIWRVPFEENHFRVTYLAEEGPTTAVRTVARNLDVSYIPEDGCYVIDLQINQTPYSSLYALVKDRVYLNRSFVVPGTQDRPEPERASVQLAIDGTSARERRSEYRGNRSTSAAAAAGRPSGPKKLSRTKRLFAFLRRITPSQVDKLVWLWDRLPHTLILAVGALLVAAQISSLLWAYAMFTEFLVEKVRLEGMSAAGLEQVKSGFQVALESGCEHGAHAWKSSLTGLHDSLEREFMGSAAAVAIYRVSVAYFIGLFALCGMCWIGFPTSIEAYLEELSSSNSAALAERAQAAAGTSALVSVDGTAAPVTRSKVRRPVKPVVTIGGVTIGVAWGILFALSVLTAILSIGVGYQYYSLPETVSQHFEDALVAIGIRSHENFPKCVEMTQFARETYFNSPHILTLRLRDETPGGGCLFGGEPTPKLSVWEVDQHGDIPLFHCNSIVMPSTVGFARLVLLAISGLIVSATLTLFTRDLLMDISVVGLKRKGD